MSDTYRLFQAAFLKVTVCADSTYFRAKDIPLHFLIDLTGQTGRLRNLHSPIRDIPSGKCLRGEPATYLLIKIWDSMGP